MGVATTGGAPIHIYVPVSLMNDKKHKIKRAKTGGFYTVADVFGFLSDTWVTNHL